MRVRSIIVTLVGLGIAGGSMLYAKSILESPRVASAPESSGLAEVVVAGMEIQFGQAIERHMLTTQVWPREALPAEAFTRIDEVTAEIGTEPRRAKRALAQGELLLASKVSDFGEKVTIVQALGENTRAMAIEVDAVSGVGGFVTPGDRVDVVLTQGQNEGLRAVTILQNIRVIGVDQTADEQNDQPGVARTITVEVTPADGQKLALAQQAGKLSLTLRTVNSVSDRPLDLISLDDLMLDKSPTPEAAPKKPSVRIRRANVLETVEMDG